MEFSSNADFYGFRHDGVCIDAKTVLFFVLSNYGTEDGCLQTPWGTWTDLYIDKVDNGVPSAGDEVIAKLTYSVASNETVIFTRNAIPLVGTKAVSVEVK